MKSTDSKAEIVTGSELGTKLSPRQALEASAAPVQAKKNGHVDSLYDNHDAIGLAELVRKRQVSPNELLEEAIMRTEALNPRFNFMAQKHYDFARRTIAAGLPEGPFTGVPWLLKDLHTSIAGEITENGSRLYKGHRATVTSELVRRIECAGFVIFGKTTVPEFGLTATTESKLTGDTRNPWNPAHIAGGSSGGAAVAVASSVLPAAHATDGGGSIRIPASCCGLFGLKPSRGRVPIGPTRSEGWGGFSVQHAISRSVRDSAAVLDATWGIERGSRYSAPTPDGTFFSQVGLDPGRLRVALMTEPFAKSPVDPQCLAAVRAVAHLCESLGHYVEEAAPKIDSAALSFAAFAIIAPCVATEVEDRSKSAGIDPTNTLETITEAFVNYAKTFSGMDYVRADHNVQVAAIEMARFLENYDVILTPTVAAPPLLLGQISPSPDCDFKTWGERAAQFSSFTQIANMTGQPAMSVPLAMSANGLPIGIQFLARYGEEALLFRLAAQLEMAAPWKDRRPPL